MKRKTPPPQGAGNAHPLRRFLLALLLALLLQGLGWAAQLLPGEGGLVCYFAVLYVGAPLAAAGLSCCPFITAREWGCCACCCR